MQRVRAIVTGRVQGVGYRASTVAEATGLPVTGWVQNLADGTVELEVQGEPADVQKLLTWCENGPPGARVTGVSHEPRPLVAGERGFVQRR
jgi:acylphosphatase